MVEGVDFAFSNPSPGGLYAAGKRFAMRYVGPGTSPKHLTAAEANALKAAGLSLVTLVEGATGDPKGGFQVGVSHARSAVAMLKARGFPTDRPMYFAIDYDVSSTSWPAAREYLRGAGSVIGAGLVGIYGEYDAMGWAARDGVAAWFFQTYAWSSGRWYPGNHVEQYSNGRPLAGGTVDLCRSKKPDFGQWGQTVQGGQPTGGDDDMPEIMVSVTDGHGGVYLSNYQTYRKVGGDGEWQFHKDRGIKEVQATEARLSRYGVPVVAQVPAAVSLSDADRAAIIAEIRVGLAIPTAAEIAEAVADEDHRRSEA